MVNVFGGLEPTCLRPPQSFPDRIDGENLLPSPPLQPPDAMRHRTPLGALRHGELTTISR